MWDIVKTINIHMMRIPEADEREKKDTKIIQKNNGWKLLKFY